MFTDNGLRLATAEVVPNAGASPGGLGAASVTLALDLSGFTQNLRTLNDIGAGENLRLNINVTTAVTSGTFASTLELQLVSLPILASLLTNATTSGKTLTITGLSVPAATDVVTIANHGLPLGTPFYFSAGSGGSGTNLNTIYYAVPQTSSTFKFAASLANAIAGTTVDQITADFTGATMNFLPTVHATTGTQLKDLFVLGARLVVPIMPLPSMTPYQALPTGQTLTAPLGTSPLATPATGIAGSGGLTANAQRYYYLRYIPSATITAGAFTVDILPDAVGDGLKFYASGMVI
jgi:hypothetical protein